MQKKPGKFSFQKGANEWWRQKGLADTSLNTVPRGKEGTWKWERRGKRIRQGQSHKNGDQSDCKQKKGSRYAEIRG